jgi:hypothetical protein
MSYASFYASAYPNSDISAGAMAAIAIVMVAALACWLVMVYVAAREPRKPRPTGQQAEPGTAAAEPASPGHGDLAEDKHMEAA